ncbi:serine hydrolase [Schlesneria paludicola]|uniref:serine hydrolase n=1 Tax=Schlesneria paludicola TaxID=360056 RepID=UPI00029A479C|nr:serine hydrolase [Schlesneria paludicola]
MRAHFKTLRWASQSACLLMLTGLGCLQSPSHIQAADDLVFPGRDWEQKSPVDAGLDERLLDAVATALGSRGCIIKNGYVVKAWGTQSEKSDWASSAKPVLSTLLMFAHNEGRVKSFDQPIVDFGWKLSEKDRGITFRHLGSMTSGYARPEGPGAAWAYNDYAIQLYQQTLFDKVYQDDPDTIFHAPERFGVLQLQDGFNFRKTNRRIRASVRDFARVAWFWMNRGNWNGQQILPRDFFDQNMRAQVPADLPLSIQAATDDYLKIGTYGGDSNHYSDCGPGIYGFNWWFNNQVGTRVGTLTWPDAPPDTVMSLGVRGNCTAMIPSLKLLVVAANADWGKNDAGDPNSVLNQRLKLIVAAGTPRPSAVETK